MRYPNTGPIDPTEQFTQRIKSLEAQVAELQRAAGSNRWPWVSYTPSIGGSGWLLGNGTISGRARVALDVVFFSIAFTIGSTSGAGLVSPTFGLPATPHADWSDDLMRASTRCTFADATGGTNDGRCALSGGSVLPLAQSAGGTYAADVGVTSTIPFTWAVNDRLRIAGWYRPA